MLIFSVSPQEKKQKERKHVLILSYLHEYLIICGNIPNGEILKDVFDRRNYHEAISNDSPGLAKTRNRPLSFIGSLLSSDGSTVP